MKDSNIIIIKDNYNVITDKLKELYEYPYENYSLEIDFVKKYKDEILKDEFLNELYKKKNYYDN